MLYRIIGYSSTWTRTRDRVINSHLLYQLSYRGMTMHLSECLLWGITPNILTVYTGVGSSTTANIQRGLIPAELAPLVGTSQVLSANSILLILFTVNPTRFAERNHHQLWTLICRSHLTTTTTFDFPHFHLRRTPSLF